MKLLAGFIALLLLMSPMSARAQAPAPSSPVAPAASVADGAPTIVIQRAGSQPTARGAEPNFTGSVRIDGRFERTSPARVGGATVTFEPGARTAWHTHTLGQTLIVTAGVGWIKYWGGPLQEIRLGDVVWIPPGLKHWHGATPTTGMTHVAISERLDGKSVDWMERVSDDQYR